MLVSLISAVSRNGVIGGKDGGIPWDLPRDKEHFREYTSGKWMLVGRKTYLEMEGWFVDQTPVVLTRSTDLIVPGGVVVHSVADAIDLAEQAGADELVVSGGAEMYRAALPFVEKLILTKIDAEIEGLAGFPDLDWNKWEKIESEIWDRDERNSYKMTLEIFVPKGC